MRKWRLMKSQVLNKFSGKDATKPFKKTHNENILKTDSYSKICVGRVENGQDVGRRYQDGGGYYRLLSCGI